MHGFRPIIGNFIQSTCSIGAYNMQASWVFQVLDFFQLSFVCLSSTNASHLRSFLPQTVHVVHNAGLWDGKRNQRQRKYNPGSVGPGTTSMDSPMSCSSADRPRSACIDHLSCPNHHSTLLWLPRLVLVVSINDFGRP